MVEFPDVSFSVDVNGEGDRKRRAEGSSSSFWVIPDVGPVVTIPDDFKPDFPNSSGFERPDRMRWRSLNLAAIPGVMEPVSIERASASLFSAIDGTGDAVLCKFEDRRRFSGTGLFRSGDGL